MSSTQIAHNASASPEQIICVLGMHRSGTSCLTGSMQEAGINLGDYSAWNPHNLKGNRENQQIVDINEAVLLANGGDWDKPLEQVSWPAQQREIATKLFAGYAEHPLFGFKDPRTLLTLGGWKALFPHMQFIGIFRDPLAVAQSLHNRSGMPHDEGLELWYQYNRRLLRQFREQAFPLLCFDREQTIFQQQLHDVLLKLGLDTGEWQGEFYQQELKSAQADAGVSIPWKVRRLYRKLQLLAE